MARRPILIYLSILAIALVLWAPLYPVLYAMNYDASFLADQFESLKPRYVYFGDSVLTSSSACDTDHRYVAQLLPGDIADKTMVFNPGGGTAYLWASIAKFVIARGHGQVKAAVVPINMAAFSTFWEGNPNYDFATARMFFDLKSEDFSAADYLNYLAGLHSFLRDYRLQKEKEAYENSPVMAGPHSIGSIQDVERRWAMPKLPCNSNVDPYAVQLGLRLTASYGGPLRADDPMFSYLDETITRLRRAGIRPIVYLTPLNMPDVRQFAGAVVYGQLQANLALVRRVAGQKGWNLMDLSGSVPGQHFARECTCEHVDTFGRKYIADHVGRALSR